MKPTKAGVIDKKLEHYDQRNIFPNEVYTSFSYKTYDQLWKYTQAALYRLSTLYFMYLDCVHIFVCVCVCPYSVVGTAEVNVSIFLHLSLPCSFETGSLPGSGAY